MADRVHIEDIEEMRQEAGIDDVELRAGIRELRIGDLVRLTFLHGALTHETLLVRITEAQGSHFHGELAQVPVAPGLSSLHLGHPVTFTPAHIHSLRVEKLECSVDEAQSAC